MTTKKLLVLESFNEDLCRKIRLISVTDRESISENRERSNLRLATLMGSLQESRLTESDAKKLQDETLKEARKLERLVILEGVADKDFYEMQKHFRSMVRAANVVVRWFHGSAVASKIDQLRTQGIEQLSALYDHIKTLEAGADMSRTGVKMDPRLAKVRDAFVKTFSDFAIVFRGVMAVADLFSDDSATIGGYNDIRGIITSLERDGLSDKTLNMALFRYDDANDRLSGKGGARKRFSSKGEGLYGQFQRAVMKAIASKTPGFAKLVPVDDVVDMLLAKSADQLQAYFGRFNDFVAADVDTDFLFKISQNPRGVGAMFKGLWNAFSGGHMKTLK